MTPQYTTTKRVIMLRSFGFVTFSALFMVGCGSGGGGGDASSPPPSPATYTVGVTVLGLVGSGLTLANCSPIMVDHPKGCPTHGELPIVTESRSAILMNSVQGGTSPLTGLVNLSPR